MSVLYINDIKGDSYEIVKTYNMPRRTTRTGYGSKLPTNYMVIDHKITVTPSDLKYHVEQGTDSHFFERSSMKFFGDTMRNYGVRSATVTSSYNTDGNYCADGVVIECWELYRRRPVKHGLQSSAYFNKTTYSRVFPAKGE